MQLSSISALPWLVPDRFIRSELKRRCTADDGVTFADIHFRLDRGGLCLVEKHKPGPESQHWGDDIWSVTYELTDEHGTPRQADQRDVLSVVERVYGKSADNDWIKRWKERMAQREADNRANNYEQGAYVIKQAQKARANWRRTTYVGAPSQLNADKQFMCGHGSSTYNDCAICNPGAVRKGFFSNWDPER